MVKYFALLCMTLSATTALAADDPLHLVTAATPPHDARLGKPKTLNDYFPFTPPATKEAWEKRRQQVREQILVAEGLWPMPEKTPLHPVIHGKIDRDGYTIEKVYFASYPGHYVSGNLYRPKGKSGKLPAILSPHGHWRNGRLTDELIGRGKNGPKYIQDQMASGAETTEAGARFPLQARCAQLARMGCVVFHYDMVGYGDSLKIAHRTGFTDADAELHLQSFMGLQTWNSIRALDFLSSLPDVDPKRIGITGASGGGTQTFILCAIDDRPAVAFPAVMVSTAMQGGCVCENCSLLRQFTGNVEIAALFAPKPLGMTGAHDWTIDIETKGLPQLQALYRLYGAENHVMAKCYPQFEHNYNQVSREVMYNWFNKHLKLGQPIPVVEKPFVPVPPRELSVYVAEHPLPSDTVGAQELRKYMTEQSAKAMDKLWESAKTDHYAALRKTAGTALRVMVHDRLPDSRAVEAKLATTAQKGELVFQEYRLSRAGQGEDVPAILVSRGKPSGIFAILIHPDGAAGCVSKWSPIPEVQKLLDHGVTVLVPDVFLTGAYKGSETPKVDANYAGLTFGYNRPLLANRVHDILTAVAFAKGQQGVKRIDLVGVGEAGPWVLLARALCGDAISRTAVDANHFRFDRIKTTDEPMTLPGIVKYGGMPTLAALCSPGELLLYHDDTGAAAKARPVYEAGGSANRLRSESDATLDQVVHWLLR